MFSNPRTIWENHLQSRILKYHHRSVEITANKYMYSQKSDFPCCFLRSNKSPFPGTPKKCRLSFKGQVMGSIRKDHIMHHMAANFFKTENFST